MDIDTMPAGPELDALVATDVMGWKWCLPYEENIGGVGRPYPSTGAWLLPDGSYQTNFRPSGYIAAAMEIIHPVLDSRNASDHGGGMGSVSMVWNPYEVRWEVEFTWSDNYRVKAVAKDLPLAISRAAYKYAKETE